MKNRCILHGKHVIVMFTQYTTYVNFYSKSHYYLIKFAFGTFISICLKKIHKRVLVKFIVTIVLLFFLGGGAS